MSKPTHAAVAGHTEVHPADGRCDVCSRTPAPFRAKIGEGWWCRPCYNWSRINDWADPATRKQRRGANNIDPGPGPSDDPQRAHVQGFLDIDHIPEIRRRYVRGNRWQAGNAGELAALYGVTALDVAGAARGNRCKVVVDGRRCRRSGALTKEMCYLHYKRELQYGDPAIRVVRSSAEVLDELRAAATATTDACIIFAGQNGRPQVHFGGKWVPAARAVYIIANDGVEPVCLDVRHTCNGGSGEHGCINIQHLTTGTRTENMRDMVEAGRSRRGERHHNVKIPDAEVPSIRARYVRGNRYRPGNCAALAAEYGVTLNTIRRIVGGHSRRHA